MARIPSSRNTVHRGLRIPDLRAGDDSPLRTSFRHAALGIFRIRRLPTQRLRPCGLNATSRTQSQPCADDCLSRLSGPSRDAHAVPLQSQDTRVREFYDAVRLIRFRHFIDGSLALASLNLTRRDIVPTLTATLTTIAFDDSSLQRFEACT